MLDFLKIETRSPRRGITEIYPNYRVGKSTDLMIKGGDFYAVWVEPAGLWSTDEDDLIKLVDLELDQYYEDNKSIFDGYVSVLHLKDSKTNMIDSWHKYCQKQCRDNYHMLDDKIIFANDPIKKSDYASKRLTYSLEKGPYDAWEELVSTLYSPEERHKIEWIIGAIISGDSRSLQKFAVLYGSGGTGKSTILNIVQMMFDGYWCVFDAKALGSSNSSFSLEPFKNNPLIAIQHDGDLSRIEDNTRLNSLVSHERMTVNEKHKSLYTNNFKAFLLMGTNKPVKITDSRSGLIRRLIDISPTGVKLPLEKYNELMNRIPFELGHIASHCLEVYFLSKDYYNSYIPINMLGSTNDFYNYMETFYSVFKKEDSITLKVAWEMYKTYCEDARVQNPLSLRVFKEELKNYFWEYKERTYSEEGRIRNTYYGFRTDRFNYHVISNLPIVEEETEDCWLNFNCTESLLDIFEKDCPAQYANERETPLKAWSKVTTTLADIDTRKLHYVLTDITHIVIDFDIPDENGNKCFKKNFEAAKLWPPTYAELSKSGEGIHLHYIYSGDPNELELIYQPHIEIKVFKGNAALRRKLSKCNDLPVAIISSGLPLKKGEKVVINADSVKSEKGLRKLIYKNLKKEIHDSTKCSVDFIKKILDDAYDSGLKYDVSDLHDDIFNFAADSTNNAVYCISLVSKMKFKSEEPPETFDDKKQEGLWFYDIEVFPNLLLINYKQQGKDPMYRLINPNPKQIEELIGRKLIGFNCRRYDNHILYAAMLGYNNEQIYQLSKKIISGEKGCFFSQAYDISYTDIYDFASAKNKKSLKKLEIEMGFHHQELGFDWDQPVPEEKWSFVSEYCDNDVLATEAAFDYLKSDWTARQILASVANKNVNSTTNSLTAKIIFGGEKKPQSQFCWRDLSKPVTELDPEVQAFLEEACPVMMSKTHTNDGITFSLLPYFPGYKFENGVSTYKGIEVGEGGRVNAITGIWINVALLDIVSMHPHSTIAECLFGPKFTRSFREIVEGRVSIKHEAWEVVNNMLEGKLTPFIQLVIDGKMSSKDLADALKTAINAVYGLTAAHFDNEFKDPRNIDNIVAKRGALFMINLEEEVTKLGFTVAHIKTDSIKIPNATPEIIKFVMDYAQDYGYTFEHEATYDRMCLVNDAVYIAKYATPEVCEKLYGYVPGDNKKAAEKGKYWTATGTQFAVPYVFKTLFSKEEIIFDDLCETKSVSKGAIYLVDEASHDEQFIGRVGRFCPMKEGVGKDLLCKRDDKFVSVTGAKDWKWLEAEYVETAGYKDQINIDYYEKLKNEAVQTIAAYGDFQKFVSDEPYPFELTTEYCEEKIPY